VPVTFEPVCARTHLTRSGLYESVPLPLQVPVRSVRVGLAGAAPDGAAGACADPQPRAMAPAAINTASDARMQRAVYGNVVSAFRRTSQVRLKPDTTNDSEDRLEPKRWAPLLNEQRPRSRIG
jgi:hypothetical protein